MRWTGPSGFALQSYALTLTLRQIGTIGTDVIWSDNFGSFDANMPPNANGYDKEGVAIFPPMNAIARLQKWDG